MHASLIRPISAIRQFSLGEFEGVKMVQASSDADSGFDLRTVRENALPEEHVLGQYIPLIYHHNMLQDELRVRAFQAAIQFAVKPGMHVVELGGGTGILSFLAARQGAQVTCVEHNPELVDCARRCIELNGMRELIEVVYADAARYTPSQPVDVVICEMLHVGLLREKQVQVIAEFKRHYVKKFGPRLPHFLPEVSILMAQPVQHSFEFAGYQAPVPMFQAAVLDQPRTRGIAVLMPYANISYDEPIPVVFDVCQHFTAEDEGQINAVRFATQNVLAVDIQAQNAITWPNQCLVLPVAPHQRVKIGQELKVSFRYSAGDAIDPLLQSLRVQLVA